ncbi:MAG: DUF1858 domain-containing protein [Sporomusaceae bacterium]|nr:DUF1858 domain-containing protein [Sporomusaceae bacterium]
MITTDTLIIDILRKYPKSQLVLKQHGMNCASCLGADSENIQSGAKNHAVNIDELLAELNRLAARQKGD